MSRGVQIVRSATKGFARCQDCVSLVPSATRERARMHVQKTGHTVVFVIEDLTTYQPEGAGK